MLVHSGMSSSHLFFCLSLLLSPCTVPCRIVLASPQDLVMCPYHFSLLRFTVVFVRPNGLPSSVSHLFVGDVVSVCDAEELSEASHLHGLYILLSVSAVSVQYSQAYRNVDMTRERISLIFELSAIFLSFQMVLNCCECCCDPGENFRFGSFICDDCSQVFEAGVAI